MSTTLASSLSPARGRPQPLGIGGPAPLRGLCLRTVIRRAPYAGSACKSELDVIPLTKAHEYESLRRFERPGQAPVLVSPSQRYRLVSQVLAGVRAQVAELGPIAIRLSGSDFNVQLGPELLAADVLLCEWPLEIVPVLVRARHRNIVAICQDLRADGLDLGNNALDVFLFAATPAAEAQFRRLCETDALLSRIRQRRMTAVEIRGTSVIYHLEHDEEGVPS